MGLMKNKRAMFFTIIAIITLSLFFLGYSTYTLTKDRSSINNRVKTMNDFVFSYEKDLTRELYISGFRIIFLLEKRIIDTGKPINDTLDIFKEAFFNGTINQEYQELMIGATFSDIQRSLSENAMIMNMNGTVNVKNLSMTQEDPWNIKITMETEIYIYDNGRLAYWNNSENITVYIPVENFEDPLYVLNTGGLATNKIKKTIYQPFVKGINVNNLTMHYQNQYYINSTLAPSFLDRLEGKISPNPLGIESLVNAQKLSLLGIPIRDISCVDYIYLKNNHTDSHQISGTDSWFRLDDTHLDLYNVTGLAV